MLCVFERVSPEIGLTSIDVVLGVIHDGKLVAADESSYHQIEAQVPFSSQFVPFQQHASTAGGVDLLGVAAGNDIVVAASTSVLTASTCGVKVPADQVSREQSQATSTTMSKGSYFVVVT